VRLACDAGLSGFGDAVRNGSAYGAYQDRTFVSDPTQPAIKPFGSIDPVSWHRAAWFVIRLLMLAALTLGPCFTVGRPFQDAAGLLSLACSIGAIVSMIFAKLAGEPLGQGSLNGWDEALAFVAVSRLAHFAMQFQA